MERREQGWGRGGWAPSGASPAAVWQALTRPVTQSVSPDLCVGVDGIRYLLNTEILAKT